ncbi:DUF4271 domain-containing protein [Halosquirtibacter xylanolyticus]|uniref:DUF4271 domain-containing protein n=1 Tax=Halosquirtibacter xylanolyticus TaxID=3374599 RepID=UPI003748554D|nr:DUF4271 domain-containing protein [Prolixibacteraceae bacterium]
MIIQDTTSFFKEDSLANSIDSSSVVSFVTTSVVRMDGVEKKLDIYDNIGFGFLLGGFMILVSVKIIFPKYLNMIFQSLVYGNVADRLYREMPYRIGHAAFRLDVLAWLMISYYGVELVQHFTNILYPKPVLLLAVLSFTAIYSFFRYYLISFLSWIFDIHDISEEFLFNNALFIKIIGIILLIINLCVTYMETPFNVLINTSLVVVSMCFVFMFFRSILVLLRKHFSIFYLILYLCTLEILPILLISKWLLG